MVCVMVACDSDVHDGVCLCVTLLCMMVCVMVCVMVACDGGV